MFKLTSTLIAATLAALIVAGCGGSNDSGKGSSASVNRTVVPYIAKSDVAYIDAIVPHHRKAIEMSQMEIDKGTLADVKALAQRFKDDQTAEITLLTNARAALTGSATVPTPPTDAHMDADMAAMMAATGAEMDAMFLDDMIPHHSEGISIAHRALPSLTRDEVKGNANSVISKQATEIGEMQALRGS